MIDTYVSSFEKKRSQSHINKVLHQVHNEINNYNPITTTQDFAEFHFKGMLKPGDVLSLPRPLKPLKVTGYANGIPLVVGTLDTTGTLVIDSNITVFNVPKTYSTTTTAFSMGDAQTQYNAYIRYDDPNIVYNLNSWDEYALRFNQVYSYYNQYRNRFNIALSGSIGYVDQNISISDIDCNFNHLVIKPDNTEVSRINTASKEGIEKVLRRSSGASYYQFNNGDPMKFGSGYTVNNVLFNYIENFTNFTPVPAMVIRGSEVGTIPAVCSELGINAAQFAVLFAPVVDGEHVSNELGMIADYSKAMVYQIASRYNAGSYSQRFSNGMTRKWEISIVKKTERIPELFAFGGDTFNNNIGLLPNNGYTNNVTRDLIGNAFNTYGDKRYRVTWDVSSLDQSRYYPPAPENYSHNVVYNGLNFLDVKRLSQKVLIEFNEASDETTLPLRLGYCPYQQYWRWNQNYYDTPEYITREEYDTGLWKICFPGYNLNYVNSSPEPAKQEAGSFIWYKNIDVKNYTIVNKITETRDEGIENLQISIDIKYRRRSI